MSALDRNSIVSARIDFQPETDDFDVNCGKHTISNALSAFYLSAPSTGQVKVFFDSSEDMRAMIVPEYDAVVHQESFTQLRQQFPNVANLTVVATHDPMQPYACCSVPLELLVLWPNLTDLSIVGVQHIRDGRATLMQTIGQLHSLKRLSMDVEPHLLRSLPVLGQIEHINMRLSKERSGLSLHRVVQCGEAFVQFMTQQTNVLTCGLWCDESFNIGFAQWPVAVCSRVTKLALTSPNAEQDLPALCAKFTSLQYLYIGRSLNGLTLVNVLPLFARLVNLTHITITVYPQGLLPAPIATRLESVLQVNVLTTREFLPQVASLGALFGGYFPNATLVYEDISSYSSK